MHIIVPWCSFLCTHNLVAELTLLLQRRRRRRRRSPLPPSPTSHLGGPHFIFGSLTYLLTSPNFSSLSPSRSLPLFLVWTTMQILGDGHVVWVFLILTIMHILGWWACWWSCLLALPTQDKDILCLDSL